MDVGAIEIGPIISGAEAPKIPERRYNRDEVLQVFNSTLDLLNKIPEDQLTPKEQADRDLVNEIKGKTIDKGKASYVNRFKDPEGNEYSQREYVPVESLINFLNVNIESGKLSEDEKKDYEERRRIIARHSKQFYDLPHRLEPSRLNARVHQEFERVQKDPRLDIGNWKASDLITDRRELILPRQQKPPVPIPTPVPTPEPVIPEPTPDPEPDPDPEPTPVPVEQIRVDVSISNRTTDPRKHAAELAEELLHSEMRRGSILNPFNWGRKVGLRIMEEYWRQRLIKQIETSMLENNNSLLTMDIAKSAIRARDLFRGKIENISLDVSTNKAKEQMEGQDTNTQLRLSAQEKTLISGQRVEEAQGALRNMMISEIIRPLVEGKITEDKIQDKLREFVRAHQGDPQVLAIFGPDANQYSRIATYFATDLKETAQVIKNDLAAHKYAIEQLNEIVHIQLANTDWAAETEAKFTRADRAIAWAEKHRLSGLLANPAVIGAAFSLAVSAPVRIAGLATKISPWVLPGLGLLPAAAFAAYRRNYDLKVDRASHQVERAYNKQIPPEAKRREALEKHAYNTASVDNMINGGGQELVGGMVRRSMKELLAADLSITSNQEALIRRITEMKSRLDFSAEQSIDLVTFESREKVSQGRLQLIEAIAQVHIALRNAGMADDVIRREEGRLTGEWRNKFTQNREQQDKSFAIYRLKQSALAGAIGGVTGLAGGLVAQEAMAGIGRVLLGQQIGNTALENFFSGKSIGEKLGGIADTLNGRKTRELYENPGHVKTANGLTMDVGKDHAANFYDTSGKKIPTPPIHVTEDGKLVFSGTLDKLPAQIRDIVGEWENRINTNPNLNLHEHLQQAAAAAPGAGHETFQHGDWIVDVNSGPNHQMSMLHYPTQTQIHGFIKPDGSLSIDHSFGGNAQLTDADWTKAGNLLQQDAWGISKEIAAGTGAGTGNALDTLLNQPPDVLRAKGIIETDQFQKQWNFHVLRPDIVDATGNHTHNELTLHLGGDYQVATKVGDQIIPGEFRHGVGVPGQLNTGSELHGGLIQSHLTGVPPQEDPVLNELIQRNGGLKMSDTVFVVDLTDGKQIMLPADLMGNGKLPDGLYDPTTGSPRGIDTIATAVIQKPDGSVMNPTELFSTGKISNGSIIHSLASERFIPGELPPIPKEIFTFSPPIATEFSPPLEAPYIPIPFVPRYPLEPLVTPENPYIYNAKLSKERKKQLEKLRSKTLKENQNAILDPYQETTSYFDRQNPKYTREIASLESQIPERPSNNLKVIACIPVAGHQEEKNIYETLRNYTYQDTPTDQFEILLFVNYPEKDKEGKTIIPDRTAAEIERFKRDYPGFPVRTVTKVLPLSQANIGTIRKYLTDIALYRQMQRGKDAGDIILISNDADQKGVAPTYISNFIKRFGQNSQTEGMLGQLDWDPEAYTQYPLVHVGTRLFQYLNAIGRQRSGRMPSSGANFAFKGSIYSAIGGYIPNIPGGEDIALGQAIVEGRGDHRRIVYAGTRVSRLYTSARRAIDALQKGLSPIEQWDREFSAFDDEIRRLQLGEDHDIDYNDPKQLETLKGGLESIINRTLDVYEKGEQLGKNAPYYKKAIGYLGIKYDVKDGKVVITDMAPLVRGLKNYQKIGVLLRDIKSGKGTPEKKAELIMLHSEYLEEIGATQPKQNTPTPQNIKEEEQKIEEKLRQLSEEKINLPNLPKPRYNLEELKSSTNTVEEGNYILCLDKPLGSGQMGQIVAGYDKNTGEIFSFKRIKKSEQEYIAKANEYPEGVTDPEDIIKDEIKNPTLSVYKEKIERADEVIKVYPIAITDLDHYLEQSKTLDTKNSLVVVIKVTEALKDLHQHGMVHLDLSPTNILLDKESIRLIDSDAASIQTGPQNEYKRGFVGGFRRITPPELFQENPKITESADTYEASILLYKLLIGKYPYSSGGGTPEERIATLEAAHKEGKFDIPDFVPNPLKQLLRKGINPNPTGRYQTANELLSDLLDAYTAVSKSEPLVNPVSPQLNPQPVQTAPVQTPPVQPQSRPGGPLRNVDQGMQEEIEMAPAQPVDLLSQVNKTLTESAEPQTAFETSPQEIVNYLKTLELPFGAKFSEATSQIDNGQLYVNGAISTIGGKVRFNATLGSDPTGKLNVISHQVDLPFLLRNRRGGVEQQITNINQLLISQINKQVDPAWEATGMRIDGNKLAFDFRKK